MYLFCKDSLAKALKAGFQRFVHMYICRVGKAVHTKYKVRSIAEASAIRFQCSFCNN